MAGKKNPSAQTTGRATKARKEQQSVRSKMLGKAKQKFEALRSSDEASQRFKTGGTWHGYQSSKVYKGTGPGDLQKGTDKYVSTKRRTTSKMKKG